MGLFDFPRIHFSGNCDINVPTINNSLYFPLTLYDQVRSEPFLPPRLYFTTVEIITGVDSIFKPTPFYDEINGYYYIEIETVTDIATLREWCMTPIIEDGTPLNKDYIPFYKAAEINWADTEGTTIMGKAIGYWNMYGDMGVSLSEVNVSGVQVFNNGAIYNYNKSSSYIPGDVSPFMNASFDLDTFPNSQITTASLVETISSQSVYANIFCSNVNLYNSENPEEVLLQGKPYRFSASIYGANRVVNWPAPGQGSARFVSSIPLENLNASESSALVSFFNNNKAYDSRPLKGIFITFQTFEVFENRDNQNIYQDNPMPYINPAQATTVGSITPWYEGDMQASILGRQLISLGQNNVKVGADSSFNMTPVMSNLNVLSPDRAIFSVDFGNTWPEKMFPNVNPPAHRGDAEFKTLDLGTFGFRYGPDVSKEFFSIKIDPINNPRESVFQTGCVFDIVINDSTLISNIQNNLVSAYLYYDPRSLLQPECVLSESPYLLVSDQKGCYGESNDLALNGYMVYSDKQEACRMRIFEKGNPVTEKIPIYLAKWKVLEAGNDPIKPAVVTGPFMLADGDAVDLSGGNPTLSMDDNAVYYFTYDGQYPNNIFPVFHTNERGYTIMDTGSFICLRVHPYKDYSQYLNPANWGTTPPDYDLIYQEVFKLYDVVYPVMALIHPFTKEVWNNGTIAGLVVQRTDPAIWNDILYMPKSRELSRPQRELLKAWAEYLKTVENAPQDLIA